METGKWSSGVAFAAVVALLVTVGVQSVRLDAARERATRAALVADTLEAVRDSSRVLSIEGAVLGESLVVVQRRAVQTSQKADALDRELRLERVARDQLSATIAGIQAQVRSDTVVVEVSGDSVRSATFDVRQAPYTMHAEVVLSRPPERGRLDVRVDLDTLALELRVGCGVADAYGVRPAEVSTVAPKWATVRLGRVEQAAGVCAAAGQREAGRGWPMLRSLVGRFGVSAGYTATRLPSGAIVGGVGVGVGIRVWP